MTTCKICHAPISHSAKRDLCQKCGVRESWTRRRANGTANQSGWSPMLYGVGVMRAYSVKDGDESRASLIEDIKLHFHEFGIYPKCGICPEPCKLYDAPGLVRVVCKRTPDYERAARIYAKPLEEALHEKNN